MSKMSAAANFSQNLGVRKKRSFVQQLLFHYFWCPAVTNEHAGQTMFGFQLDHWPCSLRTLNTVVRMESVSFKMSPSQYETNNMWELAALCLSSVLPGGHCKPECAEQDYYFDWYVISFSWLWLTVYVTLDVEILCINIGHQEGLTALITTLQRGRRALYHSALFLNVLLFIFICLLKMTSWFSHNISLFMDDIYNKRLGCQCALVFYFYFPIYACSSGKRNMFWSLLTLSITGMAVISMMC